MTATNDRSLHPTPGASIEPREGQFGLKDLFIAVTAIGILLGWRAQFVIERQDAIRRLKLEDIRFTLSGDMQSTPKASGASFIQRLTNE